MVKRLTPILLYMLLAGGVVAQQLPQYTLYTLHPFAYNPAVAGTDNTLVLTGVYRQQWADLAGAPVGQQISAQLPVNMLRSGVGLKLDNDAIGAHRTTQALVSWAYMQELGRSGLLSVGLSAGYMQYALDGTKLRAPDGTYDESLGILVHNDVQLPENGLTAGTPVFEAGILVQAGNLKAGLSAVPVFAPILEAKGGGFRLKPEQHYVLTGAYSVELGQNFALTPSFLAKTDFFVTQIELSTNIQWRENIFAGISYRGVTGASKDAMAGWAGWRVNDKTTIAYAYDFPLSALRVAHRGSHELLLRYSLNKPIGRGKLPPVIYNPRFW